MQGYIHQICFSKDLKFKELDHLTQLSKIFKFVGEKEKHSLTI